VIRSELDDLSGMALSFVRLSQLAEQRGESRQALEWTVRCVTLFDDFPHPLTVPGPHNLAVLTGALGIEALEEIWQHVTGDPLPDNVREFVSRTGETK
jgi:hypothetical protein